MTDSGKVLTVSRLLALLKETVEDNFVQVAVEGEISNLAQPSSGHLYFTLKDDKSQIRAVMFRHVSRLLKFEIENGLQAVCRGHVSIYPQRGELQLVVDALEPVGAGSLQLAFEQLKARLSAEGLFDESRKRALPAFPKRIGIVTSATGAAIHDMLRVFQKQDVGLDVEIWPVRVQGDGSAVEIADAISGFNERGNVDVLIVGRGGGSLEDLWAFNEEVVARAIATSEIPVVSAVGHEVDFTIADFVSDVRAATPTAAAEQVIKGRLDLETHIDQLKLRLATQLRTRLELLTERVFGLQRRLVSPAQQLKLWHHRYHELTGRLARSTEYFLEQKRSDVSDLAARLDILSPLKTLDRGYSIALKSDGSVIRQSDQVVTGDELQLKLSRGEVRVCVVDTK